MLIASLSPGTIKQYEKPIRLWWEFCKKEGICPFGASVTKVIEFLAQEFEHVQSYGTLNSYRSALSLIVIQEIGNNAQVKRFFKGVATLKPQKPKYDYIWEPTPILKYLSSLWPLDKIDLKNLTRKLVTLLALITGQRVQTLSKISLDNIKESENIIHIMIPERIKTSGVNRYQPLLKIPYFRDKPELCAATTLIQYLEKTKNIRTNEKRLFLTIKKPHHAAKAATISRWIKETLEQGGIDTSLFTAHSTRHASTSAAFRKGVNVEMIRKAAGWSKESEVFARFYNRPLIETSNFANAIINPICEP